MVIKNLIKELNGLNDAKDLLDNILHHIDPYSGKLRSPIESWLLDRINRYRGFDDSE